MTPWNKLALVLCVVWLTATTDVVQGVYTPVPEIEGWVAYYKTVATWDDAFKRCQNEGAVLMSPLRAEHLYIMRNLTRSVTHHTGIRTIFDPILFVSIEGVPVEDMPIETLYDQLDPEEGHCLTMNLTRVRPVSCTTRQPYLCYKERAQESVFSQECGTFDNEYKFENTSGSCYKFHHQKKKWSEAYSTCAGEGGYLAVLQDANEAKLIVDVITSKGFYVWIGLRKWADGDWRTIHGDALDSVYNDWENDKRQGNEIAGIHPETGKLMSFTDMVSFFICEKDPASIMFPE